MVDDPVNDWHRHVVVVEELAPAGEVLVGGQDDGPVFVKAVDQLEQPGTNDDRGLPPIVFIRM